MFPDRAVTVISYVLSLLESAGASKFGVDLKVNTPLLLREKSEASVPLSLQLTLHRTRPRRRVVCHCPGLPFSS